MRLSKNSDNRISMNKELQKIILNMLVPLVFCVVMALMMLAYYAVQYVEITHNVNISSKFNLDFKDTIDLKMYHYTVDSKEQTTLPISDVEDAMDLAESLKNTTNCKESRRAIQNVLDYCRNLEKKMYMIAETEDYDGRQIQLENNIYVLTNLIHEKMVNYIYNEARYMGILEQDMLKNLEVVIIIAFLFVIGTAILLLYRGLRFSKSITGPISELCENVNSVGNGEFTIPQVDTNNYEIAQLDVGIQQMAGRIRLLLESVKEEEKLQHKTQLQLLQAQINPHFLYNTLDTIVWLVESERNGEAVTMLTNLSVFFRTILSKGNDIISLEEEIMHTRSYLDIQQIRYQDILEYNISLPDELKGIRIPKLTLQPLAENALYHGVKEKRGKSTININCMETEEDIILVVSDNGIGIPPIKLQSIRNSLENSERVGFGLAAVHERVRLYFGEGYGVHIDSIYGSGTTIEVRIPKNFKPQS